MTLILHPGYPKAASTTLQEEVFKNRCGCNFISPHALSSQEYTRVADAKERVRHIIRGSSSDEWSDCRRERVRNTMKENSCEPGVLSHLVQPGRTNIYSDETLLMPNRCEYAATAFPSRLLTLFGVEASEVRAVLVLRNQVDLMYSFYVQKYPKLKGRSGHQTLQDYYFDSSERLLVSENVDIFDFHRMLSFWESEIGQEAITVLLFEELKDDPSAFAKRLARVMGAEPEELFSALAPANAQRVRTRTNAGYEIEIENAAYHLLAPIRRAAQRIVPVSSRTYLSSLSKRYLKKRKVVPGFSDHQVNLIRKRFRDGNEKVLEKYGLSDALMRKYGYLST